MLKRIIVIPRWAGTPGSDWYPWMTSALKDAAPGHELLVANMPNPGAPTIPAWTQAIVDITGTAPEVLRNTVMVGHSVGCQAVLHFLAGLEPGLRVANTLCIAGWWTVDQPWESIQPWITHTHNYSNVMAATGPIRTLLSDNDPFTGNVAENRALWESRLGAAVRVVAGAQHFNASPQPVILEELIGLVNAK